MVALLTALRCLLAVALLWQVLGLLLAGLVVLQAPGASPGSWMMLAIKIGVAALLGAAIALLGKAKKRASHPQRSE